MTSHSKSETQPPAWFTTTIGKGLAGLYLLNLDGCPAADATASLTGLWSRLVWDGAHRDWHEQADTPCIIRAFKQLATNCERWPAPKHLIAALPERDKPKATLIAGEDDRARDAERCRVARFREMGYDHAGQPLEGSA